METLGDYSINFGHNFIKYKYKYKISKNTIEEWGKLSDQAITCLNNLYVDIMSGKLPAHSCNTLGLYSYIADREEFEEYQFEGFISLEKYDKYLSIYEYYYNKYDNITLYVYDYSRTDIKKYIEYINVDKCIFF